MEPLDSVWNSIETICQESVSRNSTYFNLLLISCTTSRATSCMQANQKRIYTSNTSTTNQSIAWNVGFDRAGAVLATCVVHVACMQRESDETCLRPMLRGIRSANFTPTQKPAYIRIVRSHARFPVEQRGTDDDHVIGDVTPHAHAPLLLPQ